MKHGWMLALGLCAACPADSDGDGNDSSSSTTPTQESGTSPSTGVESESGSEAGSSEAGSSEAGSSETGTIDVTLDCLDPQPLLQADGVTPSGWVTCSDGFTHRVEAVACLPQIEQTCDGGGSGCTTAADCTEAPMGACVLEGGGGGCECVYGCESDADCQSGEVCWCARSENDSPRCVPANCETTADCGEGLCGVSGSNGCEFDLWVACLEADSECRDTVCTEEIDCACYVSSNSFEYQCHAECGTGCG